MEATNERCPWCGSAISHGKFVEIETRIRTEEQKRLSEAEATMRLRLEGEAKATAQKAIDDAANQVASIVAERDELLKKTMEESKDREVAIRKQAEEEAAKQLAAISAERDLILQNAAREAAAREIVIRQQAEEEAAKRLATVSAERDAMSEKAKEAEAREVAIRTQAEEQTAKQLAALSAERDAMLQMVKESEDRQATIRTQVEEESAKRLGAFSTEREAMLRKINEAEAREAAIRTQSEELAALKAKEAVDIAEQQKQKDLNELRTILEADRDQTVLNKQAEFAREREAWQKKVSEMDHQLQRMNANQIGEGAEVNLFESLKEAFQGDIITRVKKGQPGADIHHDVMHKGELCGRFVYDSKNRQAWQYTYATKLREDQLEADADHAILCTITFPSGKKELCLESDVIVVNPARAVHIIQLLRRAMVEMHIRGLSMKQRAEKTNELYRFITSASYSQRFNQVVRLTDEMLEIDVQEKKAHDTVWKRRGTLLTRQGNVLREIDTEISAVIEGTDNNAKSAA